MNKEELNKTYLLAFIKEITKPSKTKNQFICPFCNSGANKNGTGAFTYYPNTNKCHCFSCGKDADLYDLIGFKYGLDSFKEQINKAQELFNCEIDNTPREKIEPVEANKTDYKEYFIKCKEHLNNTNYLSLRGISYQTAIKYHIGYDEERKKIIIPTSRYSYLARATSDKDKIQKQKYGKVNIFNLCAAFKENKPIFVVEGEIDALSILEIGFNAIGLGSTTNTNKLIDYLKDHNANNKLFICLDNDAPGKEAQEKLIKGLEEISFKNYEVVNINGQYKDSNEALMNNREEFIKRVESIANKDKQDYILEHSNKHYLNDFINGIKESANTECIPTYFSMLDTFLGGGLYEGLYVLGGVSSLGKTTLALQLMENIAISGKDVLIFSLEMARNELIAKSISRNTFIESGNNKEIAKTNRDITTYSRWKYYSDKEKEVIQQAFKKYETYADKIFIYEGVGDIGVIGKDKPGIREMVEDHINKTGNKPVVLIDYLQILAPYNDRASDKQNIDTSIRELKRLSRDFKIPVMVISSLNRESYKDEISESAYKESGAIEYTCDVLLGLQFKGVRDKKTFNMQEAKRSNERDIELLILKNRNGETGNKISLKYITRFNYFYELKG